MNCIAICAAFGLILFIVVCGAGPVVDDVNESLRSMGRTNSEEHLIKKLNGKCATRDDSSCLVLKSYLLLNRLLKKARIEMGNFEITKTSETTARGGSRSLDGNTTDNEQISQLLFDKVWTFVRTRSLKWKVMDLVEVVISSKNNDAGVNVDFSLLPTKGTDEEARKKKNNNMGAILAAAALKLGLLKALALKGIALLVGKALLISKLALVLSIIIGLKKLFSKEDKHVTYEVVGHPHQETHHEHSFSNIGGHDSYGGWARSFDGNELAYRAHAS